MLRFPDGINVGSFLQNYWQKKALLFTQGLTNATQVISSDELIALSQNEAVESRLIRQSEAGHYQCLEGPFNAGEFLKLRNQPQWTLLVQSVNLWYQEVAQLLKYFDFLPRWRLDDIMISFATDGGGVGPHVDEYDVFLLQIEGQRLWQVGPPNHPVEPIVLDCGLKQIRNIPLSEQFLLNPGDMLYLPPNTAHNGISQGNGMTVSIGFRSPALSELTMVLADGLQRDEHFYRDPPIDEKNNNPSRISSSAANQAVKWFHSQISDKSIIQAFGQLQTQPKQEANLVAPEQSAVEFLQGGGKLQVDPASRLAWYVDKEEILLFSNGEDFSLNLKYQSVIEQLSLLEEVDLIQVSAYISDNTIKEVLEFLTGTAYLGIEVELE